MAQRPRSLVSRFVLLLLTGVACGGGGGEAPQDAPTNLVAIQSPVDFDWIDFSWTPPAGTISGYEGEGRIGAGPWESLGVPIPPDAIGGTIEIDDAIPELTDFTFRIRAVRGGARSAWSNEAAYLRALRWPTGATTTVVTDGILLSWQNASAAASGVRIEVQDGAAWRTVADLPATATSHVDASHLLAGQPRLYRILATHGATASLPAWCSSAGFPPTPVSNLTATTEAGGVRLRWTNPPLETVGLVVHRGGANSAIIDNPVSGVLPPGTTEYLDAAPPGFYRYEVQIRFGLQDVPDMRAGVLAVANPTGQPPFVASLVRTPLAWAAARDALGTFAFAGWGANGLGLVFRGEGAPPDHDLGTGGDWVAPVVLFDPSGRPHAMLVRPVEGDPDRRSLVHVWYEGATWLEEEVARRAFDYVHTIRFACDGAGTLHAAWTIGLGAVAEYARRDAGAWIVEDLAAVWPAGAQLSDLAIEGSGVPALLATPTDGGSTLLRGAPGWSAGAVPWAGYPYALGALPAGVGVLQYGCVGTFPTWEGWGTLLELTSAGWAPVSVVWTLSSCAPIDGLGGRASPDGERWLVWFEDSLSMNLRFRERNSPSWTEVVTGLGPRVVASWFDTAGKAGLLVCTEQSGLPGEDTSCVQLTEP